MSNSCLYEPELWEEIASGRWPAASPAELRDHVKSCAGCGALAVTATALREDRQLNENTAPVPPSGAVWFRMQLRAKREQKETAAKVVRRAHGSLIALTLLATIVALSVTSVLTGAWGWVKRALADLSGAAPAMPSMTVVLLMAIPVVLMSIVAAYFAFSDVDEGQKHSAKQ